MWVLRLQNRRVCALTTLYRARQSLSLIDVKTNAVLFRRELEVKDFKEANFGAVEFNSSCVAAKIATRVELADSFPPSFI